MNAKRKRSRFRFGVFVLGVLFCAGITYGVIQAGKTVQSFVTQQNWGRGNLPGSSETQNNDIGIVMPKSQIRSDDEDAVLLSMKPEDISKGNLILVNNEVLYPFIDETDCVSLFDYKSLKYNVKDKNVLVSETVIDSLNQMLDDFYELYGLSTVNVVSGYRTYDFQETLYKEEVKQKGEAEANRWVAKPGGSEHHTGLAVDFSLFFKNGTSGTYDGKGDYGWINESAYQYGFIVRYDQAKKDITGIAYEPWHFRYVGLPHAYVMAEKNMCLEEYIDYLRNFEYRKEHLLVQYGNTQYEIYYMPGTDVYVPKDKQYELSGNNVDGFIVTLYNHIS